MKTLKTFVEESGSFDFDILDGPKTLRTRGGSYGQKGIDPIDALTKKHVDMGCENVIVSSIGQNVYKVMYNYPGDRSRTVDYYRLK